MPGGDRTGPQGVGSRTGRNLGYCAGYSSPGFMNWGRGGRCFRSGFGQRRGFAFQKARFSPYANYSSYPNSDLGNEQKLEHLQNTAKAISEELAVIEERIAKIKKEKE